MDPLDPDLIFQTWCPLPKRVCRIEKEVSSLSVVRLPEPPSFYEPLDNIVEYQTDTLDAIPVAAIFKHDHTEWIEAVTYYWGPVTETVYYYWYPPRGLRC